MKIRRRVAAVAAGTALLASVPVVMAGTAQAATPPWEPDPASLGGISFYDATGHLLTGGTNLSHVADYVAASSGPSTPTAFKATLYFAAPDHTKTPDQWFVQQASASKTFPNAAAPAPLTGPGFTKPLVSTNAAEGNVSTFLSAATLDTTAGYANLIQVRVFDNTSDPSYWSADLSYDTTAGTWTQVFPAVTTPTSTTTSLGVTPASPQVGGTTLTLTASVTPSAAIGTVQFMDGATNLGSANVSGGTAQITSSTLAAGSHSLTAVFQPADTTAFSGSTSSAQSYTITSPAVTTTTAVSALPVSPVVSGTSVTFTASVTPASAVGSVQFKDGATNLGSPVAVSGGTAALPATTTLTVGTHSITAAFTPTNPANFTASTSSALSFAVNSAGPTSTTTALNVAPTSPAAHGSTETLTATVTPSGAVGSVAFMDGATQVGSTQTVAAGTASVGAVLADGSHSLTAVFTPTDATAFSGSTSTAVPYDVTPAGATATTTVLDVIPASPASSGATETLTATVTPSDAAGSVAFMDGAAQVGSTQTVAVGTASVSVVLADGSHSLTAVFTPDDPTAFAGSTSEAVDYTVTGVGPVATTTELSAAPSSPASHGATETLTATVTPADAAGTIDFFDGSTQLGTTQTVSAGSASVAVVLADGAHSLTAVFTPADASAFASSTSAELSYTVNAETSAHRTRLHLSVWPSDHAFVGQRVFLAATISPHWAHGTVEFFSGGRLLGVAHLKDGVAKLSTRNLRVGSHGLWARYVPFNPDNFRKSASNSVRIQILPIPCKGHGHDGDASPAVFFVGRAQPPAAFDVAPVASTSSITPSTDGGAAAGTEGVLVLGLLVSGAASILMTRRGTTPGRGPTAD